MDASNSTATVGDFRVADLYEELVRFSENARVIEEAEEVIAGMLAKLRPVLRYITAPVRLIHNTVEKNAPRRWVKVMEETGTSSFPSRCVVIFLDEYGNFHAALETQDISGKLFQEVWDAEKDVWKHCRFGKVFEGLEHLLMVATEKHRAHYDSLKKRHNMLKKLKAIVSEPL